MNENRRHQTKRVVIAVGKLNWVCAGLVLGATAIILPAQTLTTLHSFDVTDGANPEGSLIQATDGNLYGTTPDGGSNGYGTIFKISPGGALTTLHSFCSDSGCTDGGAGLAGLVQATNGTFYGTTYNFGADGSSSYGTIFKFTSGGKLTTLNSFSGGGKGWHRVFDSFPGHQLSCL